MTDQSPKRKRMGRPLRPSTEDNAVARFRAARPGMTQGDLAELTGYSITSISRMESNETPVSSRMLAILKLLEDHGS